MVCGPSPGRTVKWLATPSPSRHVGEGRLRFVAEVEEPYDRLYLTYASDAGERFFGFGTQYTHLDLKGHEVPIFIQEQGIGRGEQPVTLAADWQADAGGDPYTSYASVPHYVTSEMRSLFLENYEYSAFDLRQENRVQVEVFSRRMERTDPGRRHAGRAHRTVHGVHRPDAPAASLDPEAAPSSARRAARRGCPRSTRDSRPSARPSPRSGCRTGWAEADQLRHPALVELGTRQGPLPRWDRAQGAAGRTTACRLMTYVNPFLADDVAERRTTAATSSPRPAQRVTWSRIGRASRTWSRSPTSPRPSWT